MKYIHKNGKVSVKVEVNTTYYTEDYKAAVNKKNLQPYLISLSWIVEEYCRSRVTS